ncbi:MAG TPA: glycerol-3-phosphate 1-O-acyltransferase PlsY [Vicinamibacteria bacterium]|nr:glycerol-3-phosphate 1-O-acyltransferase PlsY [Vicinamibacteria bacterium]
MEQSGDVWLRAAVVVAAYLLGSIPFSYLVARRRGVDVRAVGSGNVGATNVMRSVGRGAGLLAFALDFLKGAAASQLGRLVEPRSPLPALCAALAVLGHMYPVWLRFRGGKGVATGAGAFLPLAPAATLAALVTFAVSLAVTRYVSLASIAGTLVLALAAFLLGAPTSVVRAAAGMAVLIVWKHRANLQRIVRGTESRLGSRSASR